jgi:hypothetical protein
MPPRKDGASSLPHQSVPNLMIRWRRGTRHACTAQGGHTCAPGDMVRGRRRRLAETRYFVANTSPAINVAASSCSAGMVCE